MAKKLLLTVFGTAFVVGLIGYNIAVPTVTPVVSKEEQADEVAEDIRTVHISGILAEKTKTELIGDSQVILSGEVKEILPSRWSNPNFERGEHISNVIQTDVIVKVGNVFKGQPYSTKEVAIRINKGKVGNVEWKSEGFPDFELNEKVVLFLINDDSDNFRPDEQYYVLTGMKQGKFSTMNQVNDTYSNGRDKVTTAVLPTEIPVELEKYKKLPKMADPKVYKP